MPVPEVTLRQHRTAEPYGLLEFEVGDAPARACRRVDVLLVHGLGGDPIKTWVVSLKMPL
jgi:hypothetical protein